MAEMIIPDWEMVQECSIPLAYESQLRAAFQAELSETCAVMAVEDDYTELRQQRLQELADVNGWNLQLPREYSAEGSELTDKINQMVDEQNSATLSTRENRFRTLMDQKKKLSELAAGLAAATNNKEAYIFTPSGYTVARTGHTVFFHELSWNKLYLWCEACIDPQGGFSIPYSALETSFIFEFIPPITGYYRFESQTISEGYYLLLADSWELSQAFAGATLSTWFQVEHNGLLPRQVLPHLKLYGSKIHLCLFKQFYYAYNPIYAAVLQKGVKTRIHVGVKLETLARGFTNTARGSQARWECAPKAGYFCVPWVHYKV